MIDPERIQSWKDAGGIAAGVAAAEALAGRGAGDALAAGAAMLGVHRFALDAALDEANKQAHRAIDIKETHR